MITSVTQRKLKAALAIMLCTAAASCDDLIYQDEEECYEGVELRFVYDYNMEWANAFPSQVDCLTVFIYDESGNLVSTHTESSDTLSSEDYRMRIDLAEGNYTAVAYGGMECADASFAFTAESDNNSLTGRRVALATTTQASDGTTEVRMDAPLHDHFFGTADFTVKPADYTYTAATVEMMKNTNHFRIILSEYFGHALDPSWFEARIVDDNTSFNYDNGLLATGTSTTYYPWTYGAYVHGLNEEGEEWQNAYYELSTSRLIKRASAASATSVVSRSAGAPVGTSSVTSPRLIIKRLDTDETLVDLPLIRTLLMFKSEYYSNLDDQEFLDRQSRWTMMFYLDRQLHWMSASIIVNDWTVRLNNIEE